MTYKAIFETPISGKTVNEIKEKYSIGKTEYGRVYSIHAIRLLFGQETFNKTLKILDSAFYSRGNGKEKTVIGVSDYGLIRMIEYHNHNFEKEYNLPELEELQRIEFDADEDRIISPEGSK